MELSLGKAAKQAQPWNKAVVHRLLSFRGCHQTECLRRKEKGKGRGQNPASMMWTSESDRPLNQTNGDRKPNKFVFLDCLDIKKGGREWCFDLNSDQTVILLVRNPGHPEVCLFPHVTDGLSYRLKLYNLLAISACCMEGALLSLHPCHLSSCMEYGLKMTRWFYPSFPQRGWSWVATSAKDLGWKQIQMPG